jgi:hypothetical protein
MTNYVKSTAFTSKDTLPSGNALKIVKGAELDTEFNNLAVSVATKADLLSPVFTGTPTAPTAVGGTSNTQLATTAFTTAAVAAALQVMYPVGSVYINASVSTNPNTLFGFGTWVAFGGGRVPVGITAGDASFDVLEETGGSKDSTLPSHTHTVSSSGTTGGQSATHNHGATSTVTDPGHSHTVGSGVDGGPPDNGFWLRNQTGSLSTSTATTGVTVSTSIGNASADHTHAVTVSSTAAAAGASPTNTNLQPYIVVAMWKRTA